MTFLIGHHREGVVRVNAAQVRDEPGQGVTGAAGLDLRKRSQEVRRGQEGAYESAVEVSLSAAGLGSYEGRVLRTKQPGNGVRLFRNSGRFYFRVDASFADWRLKVIELTEEEAAQYTPRGG